MAFTRDAAFGGLGGHELVAGRLDSAHPDGGDRSRPTAVHVIDPASLPNPNWLRPGIPGAGQQNHGDQLLSAHKFVAIPSAVSTHSWNLIFIAATAAKAYKVKLQERFALDTRLHPPGV